MIDPVTALTIGVAVIYEKGQLDELVENIQRGVSDPQTEPLDPAAVTADALYYADLGWDKEVAKRKKKPRNTSRTF